MGAAEKVIPTNGPEIPTTGQSPAAIANAALTKIYQPGTINLYFLGIGLTLSGAYVTWNAGLATGVYSYLIVYIAMGLGYVTFCLCLAEVTSALPFAGGAFGLARCTLGFFPAYLIGCCETLEYIASVAFQVVCVADIAVRGIPSLDSYKPLIWLWFYLHTTISQCIGGIAHWLTIAVLGGFNLALLVVHDVGIAGAADLPAVVVNSTSAHFVGGVNKALTAFPAQSWWFLGIEALNLASSDTTAPKTQIPIAQVACVCTLFVVGLFTFLVSLGLPANGGIAEYVTAFTPLDKGFEHVFSVSPQRSTLLSLPSQVMGAYSLHWASAKLIHAMGESKLLPDWMGATSARYGTAHVAIIVASIVGYATCLLVYYVPSVTGYLLPVCLLFAFCSYSGQCVGYISLKLNYPIAKQCQFKNPLGIAGAVYALCVWVVAIISILAFSANNGMELVVVLCVLFVLAVYYVMFARKRQIMSEEESKVLLVAHIARFNMKRRHKYTASGSSKSVTKPQSSALSSKTPAGKSSVQTHGRA